MAFGRVDSLLLMATYILTRPSESWLVKPRERRNCLMASNAASDLDLLISVPLESRLAACMAERCQHVA
jgi:hypothetical protein